MTSLYGAVEAGGTKFVCAVGSDPACPRDIERIPTSSSPDETVAAVVAYFEQHGPVKAIGVGSFGPIDQRAGVVTSTPKLGWQGFALRDAIRTALHVTVGFDTDVNAAVIGEARCGAHRGLRNLVYVTVGTGIGGGAVVGGLPLRGLGHPEMGHLLVRQHPDDPSGFDGVCPYHSSCLEGLACGPALEARWNTPANRLPPEHAGWRIEAYYLAQLCMAVTLILSPEAILLGGGVMTQQGLFAMIREQLEVMMRGYVALPEIAPPSLPFPGLSGALVLAMEQ